MTPSALKESWQMLDLSYHLDNPAIVRYQGEQVNLMVIQKKNLSILNKIRKSQVLRDIKIKYEFYFLDLFKVWR